MAIRATNTAPRGWRGPPLVHVRPITPSPKVAFDKSITDAEAEQLYLRQLDDLGDVVVGDLAIVARQYPGQALIVLCFEDVEAGESCHRRWFAGLDARPLTGSSSPSWRLPGPPRSKGPVAVRRRRLSPRP